MEEIRLSEDYIVNKIKEFLENKSNGNWHEEKTKIAGLHRHGPDLVLTGEKLNGERFIIECKGKSYAKSAKSINSEGWIHALGQIITRMKTSRVIKSGKYKGEPNRAVKYGLGLYWKSAQVALHRIPKEIAKTLNLYIFSCNENGEIKQFPPSSFQRDYRDDEF